MAQYFYTFILVLLFTPTLLLATFKQDISTVEDVQIQLTAPVDKIVYTHDFMLTITVQSDTQWEVDLPEIRTRFIGFTCAEDFSGERIESGSYASRTYQWRLTPGECAPWRLLPFAVNMRNKINGKTRAFATRAVTFLQPEPLSTATGDAEVDLKPLWIRPTIKTFTFWGLALFSGVAFIFVISRIIRYTRRRIKEYRMSPSERAMTELTRLLARNLLLKGDFKTFYSELTLVVRRYIERSYAVRASRQTTQEFLRQVMNDQRFTQETVTRLSDFLEQADMIKFAGIQGSEMQAEIATTSAKTYITSDTQHQAESSLEGKT